MKNFKDKKIIITGATGGIGEEICKILEFFGAKLILIGSNQEKLQKLCSKNADFITADLSSIEGIKDLASIISEMDNVDCLINLAGISYFGSLGMQKIDEITKLYNVNLLAPVILSQAVLPDMIKKNQGHIVNIGSTFGSIAFGFFATYSSSKAGLRSFSEAMRREIATSDVKITYIAPRAVKTPINDEKVIEFLKKTGANIDDAKDVAKQIVDAIIKKKKNVYFGFAESKFVRINYLLPHLVDKALAKNSEIAKEILGTVNKS
jgi:short-subunit dehydrogenase